jgi:FtsH-binding integral membrane protein
MTASGSWRSLLTQPVFLWWAASLIARLGVDWLFKYGNLQSPARSLIGLLPPLMFIFVIVAYVRSVAGLDELQQRIHMQAAATAFVLAAILILVLSALDGAGIYHPTLGGVRDSLIFLLMISYVVPAWKYR